MGLNRPLLVVGGPRFDPSAAHDLGVDKIFGRGTTPREVASYLVHALAVRGEGGGGMSSHVGLSVTHRRYVKYGDAHYGGNLVDGAYVLGLFGDVATEVCIRTDADEGLFASYSDVQFRAPVLAGDILEATATVTAVGRRSRQLAFEARVVCRVTEPVTRGFGRLGARRAHRRRHRGRHRRGTTGLNLAALQPPWISGLR